MTLGPFMEQGGQQQTRNPHLKMHIGSAKMHQTHRCTASAVSDGFVLKQIFVNAGAYR